MCGDGWGELVGVWGRGPLAAALTALLLLLSSLLLTTTNTSTAPRYQYHRLAALNA